jgi:acyl-CoA thioesterase II
MGNFGDDTRVEERDGVFHATFSRDWEIWGPNGGYIAAVALRAAGRVARIPRPVSFYCHFVRPARFAPAELRVTPIQQGRQSESLRVSVTQEGKTVLEAMVRTAVQLPGLEHDDAPALATPPPGSLPTLESLRRPEHPRFAFWDNFDVGVLLPERFTEARGPLPPNWREWYRFRPEATFADPFLDAGRALVLIDTLSWPAAWLQHPEPAYIAPSLDVAVFFHRPAAESPWLLAEHHSPVATDGLIGGSGRVFDDRGRLVASGGAQLLCQPVPR